MSGSTERGMAEPGDTQDLAGLSTLDESVLLEELKIRYAKDKIYVKCIKLLESQCVVSNSL